ncbi:hypothetical protein [Phenylobacterium sp.]|uniref:hypothetical protein n=1 Tax=Phenylobacterium sp. TaxID=1871053 RepID=UPI002FDF4939
MAVALLVVAVGALTWPIVGPLVILPAVVPVAAPVIARPPAVPKGANAEFDFKSGTTWRWRRPLPSGCARWMASEDWADVNLSSDRNCAQTLGVSYFTSADHLVFRWHTSGSGGGRPCPGAIAPEQIVEFRALAAQALALSETAAEKAVLRRMDERLAVTDGAALTTDASGYCNDLKPEDYHRRRPRGPDLWR